MVECYFWAVAAHFEPQYSRSRIFYAKVISMVAILDDTYDAYGTYQELEIFTEAIERYQSICTPFMCTYDDTSLIKTKCHIIFKLINEHTSYIGGQRNVWMGFQNT